MTRAEIAEALRAKGITYSIIAEALDVSRQHVQNVVSGFTFSDRVARAIANVLDVEVEKLFPESAHRLREVRAARRLSKVSELRRKFENAGLTKRRSEPATSQGHGAGSFGTPV